MRGWCICLSADYPAAALFKKSVSAGSFCRECYVNKHDEDATSFLEGNGDLECECCLRDESTMAEDFARYQSDAKKEEFLTSIGMNSFSHAFTRVPHFDITHCVPYDFMHCERRLFFGNSGHGGGAEEVGGATGRPPAARAHAHPAALHTT